MKEQLFDHLAYDLWANNLWLEFLESQQPTKEHWDIFDHLLRSQTLWYKVVTSQSLKIEGDRNEKMNAIHNSWKELLRISDPKAYSSFNSIDGKTIFASVDQIVNHMVNHGTYHRGQLREMFDGHPGIPETDIMIYYHPDTKFY